MTGIVRAVAGCDVANYAYGLGGASCGALYIHLQFPDGVGERSTHHREFAVASEARVSLPRLGGASAQHTGLCLWSSAQVERGASCV